MGMPHSVWHVGVLEQIPCEPLHQLIQNHMAISVTSRKASEITPVIPTKKKFNVFFGK
jgi:hypothetical protein